MPADIKYIPPDYERKPAIELRLEKTRSNVNSVLSNSISGDPDPAYSETTLMNPSADDRIDNEKIIEYFNKIYGKVKGESGKFVKPIDINGDGTLDTVEFELRDTGSVSIDPQDPIGGRWLGVGFLIAGEYLGKVYAVFESGKIKYYKDGGPLCKRQFVEEEDIEKFFDNMLKHYEK